MILDLDKLIVQVKHNCNISDAGYWGYYSICGMLLRMRELYRHEHLLKVWDSILNEDILPWISEREALWVELEETSLCDIDIDSNTYSPFEIEKINEFLIDHNLFYSAGYGLFHKPLFSIAQIKLHKMMNEYHIWYLDKEICRDMGSSIAMVQGKNIFIRLEMLCNLLWEKSQELSTKQNKIHLIESFKAYGIGDKNLSQEEIYNRIEKLSLDLAEMLIIHEYAEALESENKVEWLDVLQASQDRYTELHIRGIKDLLADFSENGTLNYIYSQRNKSLLGFYLSFLDNLFHKIYPPLFEDIRLFFEKDDWEIIKKLQVKGLKEITEISNQVLEVWKLSQEIHQVSQYLILRFE